MPEKVPLLRPYFDSDEIQEIKKVLNSGWVSQGPKTKELEAQVSEYLGAEHAIATSNCTAALHLSLLSLGIGKGDEVLVADYTFPATGHAVLYCGAKPVFIDVDPETYNMDPALIEEKINDRTKAIIPVHTFGNPSDMGNIMKISENYELPVIEDAACAFGAKFDDKHAGTFGDVGCFSFHARKGITTGEGGMAITSASKLANHIRKLSVFGYSPAWERENQEEFFVPVFTELGYNYKMSDILAAVGVAQMKKLDSIISMKRQMAQYWDSKLKNIAGISHPRVHEKAWHIYQSYVPLLDAGIDRNLVIQKLAREGVQAQIGTYASHIQPIYDSSDECPVSLEIFNRALALPMFYGLDEQDIDFAAEKLDKVLEELR